jgi:hypothetical protein
MAPGCLRLILASALSKHRPLRQPSNYGQTPAVVELQLVGPLTAARYLLDGHIGTLGRLGNLSPIVSSPIQKEFSQRPARQRACVR